MKLLRALVLVSAIVFVVADDQEDEKNWKAYKDKYDKKHKPEKESSRKANFRARNMAIEKHNKENKRWKMGHNKFSDWTKEELKSILGAIPMTRRFNEEFNVTFTIDRANAIPDSIDYSSHPCMPAVKDQGQCSSCWAFAAITPIEFNRCKKTGSRVSLSEQMLVDCDVYNNGCVSGMYYDAWKYILERRGAMRTSAYPYVSGTTGTKGSTCKYSRTAIGAQVSSYNWISSLTSDIMNYLNTDGPLASAMMILDPFFYYTGGVYSDPSCIFSDSSKINHAVTIVGYGTMTTTPFTPYWIVRNSWGTRWGLKGYFLIEREKNMCNIESWAANVRVV